jgi:hypothetical protein
MVAIGQVPFVPSFIADRSVAFMKGKSMFLWKIFGDYGQTYRG